MPRMPDTRIPLAGGGDDGGSMLRGPMATLGALMQIKEGQLQHQQRLRKEEMDRREIEDDDAIRTTLPRYARPDDAIDDLYKQGRATAAAKLGTSIFTERKKQLEAYDAKVTSTQKRMDQAAQMLHGIADGDEVSYQATRPAVVELLQPVYGQTINDLLPTQYDAKRIKALVAAGTKRSEQMTGEHNATLEAISAADKGLIANPYAAGGALAQPGLQAGATWSKAALEIQDHLVKAASIALPNAQNKVQWDAYLTSLHNQGASDDTLRRIPQWDEANPDAARKAAAELGLSQKERADIVHQKETEKAAVERNKIAATRATAAAATAGAGGRGITPTRQSEIKERRNKRNAELEEAFKAGWAVVKDVDVSGMPEPERRAHELNKTTVQNEYVDAKLQIENDARNEDNMPSLEDAAKLAVAEGNRQAYDTVKRKFDAVTTGLRKLETVVPWSSPQDRRAQIDTLRAEFASTSDPVRKAEIQAAIRKLTSPAQ